MNHLENLCKVRHNWNVELKPVYLLTDCDPSKTINKVSAIVQKGKEKPDEKPVAFVGFACDAEQKVFGDLASLWNIPIISTGYVLIIQKYEIQY